MAGQEINGENKIVRDERGRIVSGTVNPHGRPKGAGISITTEIKRKLEQIPEGQKKTYLQILIDRILKQAIIDGDDRMIDRIWAYVDGSPKQNLNIGADEEVGNVEVGIKITRNENSQAGSDRSISKEL